MTDVMHWPPLGADVMHWPPLGAPRLRVSKYRCDEWCPVWPAEGEVSLWPCSIYPTMYEGGMRAGDLVAFLDVTPPWTPAPRRVSAVGVLTGWQEFRSEAPWWINCDGDEVEGPRNRWWFGWEMVAEGDARLPGDLDRAGGPVRHGPEMWGGQNAPTTPVPRPVRTWASLLRQMAGS